MWSAECSRPGVGPEIYVAEFFCSILILIGYRSRLAAIPLIITMLVALLIVHGDDPILEHWNILLYIFTYAILLHLGGGKYSLTYYLQNNKVSKS